MSGYEWMGRAACAGADPERWFPDPRDAAAAADAAAVCQECPVRGACLDYALREQLNHGIFAGTMPAERTVLRSKRGIRARGWSGPLSPHGTAAAYRRHLRHGEPPCEACRRADSLRHAPYAAARRAAYAAARQAVNAG